MVAVVEKEEVVVMVTGVREPKHAMGRGRVARRGRETAGLVIVHVANRDRDAGLVRAAMCGSFVVGVGRRVAAGRDEMGWPAKSRRAAGAREREQAT